MEKRRCDKRWCNIWQLASSLAEEHGIPVTKPRTGNRQIHRANAPAETIEVYWCLNFFYPFIDQLVIELQDRICKPMPDL